MAQPQRKRSGGLLGALSKRFSSPTEVQGSINAASRVVEPAGAMILEEVAVAEVGMERGDKGEFAIAIELRGHINTTDQKVNPLVLCSPDAAALLVAQITGLVRHGRTGMEFDHALIGRMEEAIGG